MEGSTESMFEIGDKVVYGVVGVCEVENIDTPPIKGISGDYYFLQPVFDSKGIIYSPVDSNKVMIRSIMTVKEAAKTTTKKAAATKTAAKTAVKKAAAKKEVKTETFIQYNDEQTDMDAVLKRVEADLKAQKVAAKDIKLYIKPQDGACYYVADGKVAGRVDLF